MAKKVTESDISRVMAELGRRGSRKDKQKAAKARSASLTPEQRQEISSKAGKARLKKISPAQRSAIAKKAAAARWKKKES